MDWLLHLQLCILAERWRDELLRIHQPDDSVKEAERLEADEDAVKHQQGLLTPHALDAVVFVNI